MPSLAELKAKWFLRTTDTTAYPPQTRHAGSLVSDSTDGNLVRAVRDGENYMAQWADELDALRTAPDPTACEVWLTGWRLEGVATRGRAHPESDALEMLDEADEAGVGVYGMISRHLPMMPFWYWAMLYLNTHGVWRVAVDNRFPNLGSGHQKFTCFRSPARRRCMVGSIDISRTRWDTDEHRHGDARRPTMPSRSGLSATVGPTHDVGVVVEGPAVADVERTFLERWNDPTRTLGLISIANTLPPLPTLPPVTVPGPVAGGTHSVQVLHTYGRATAFEAYSWSPTGEFTVWASYLNALRTATRHIYVEDQYFLPFGYPPTWDKPGTIQERSDLHYQLGMAIRRGVKVLVVTPSNAEDSTHGYQKFQRDIGIEHLTGIAGEPGVTGRLTVLSLTNGTSDIYVHSKLMIVDDELVLVGSANWGRRSMTFDSEIQLAIVDEAETFAAGLRTELWAEHLGVPPDSVRDPDAGYELMAAAAVTPTGHLKPYPYESPGLPTLQHRLLLPLLIEPGGGPER